MRRLSVLLTIIVTGIFLMGAWWWPFEHSGAEKILLEAKARSYFMTLRHLLHGMEKRLETVRVSEASDEEIHDELHAIRVLLKEVKPVQEGKPHFDKLVALNNEMRALFHEIKRGREREVNIRLLAAKVEEMKKIAGEPPALVRARSRVYLLALQDVAQGMTEGIRRVRAGESDDPIHDELHAMKRILHEVVESEKGKPHYEKLRQMSEELREAFHKVREGHEKTAALNTFEKKIQEVKDTLQTAGAATGL